MRNDIYKAMVGLPSKIGAGTCLFIGAAAILLPEGRISQIVAPYLSAENTRWTGILLLAFAVIYFALLWLLKPSKQDEPKGPQRSLHNHGVLVQDNASFQNAGTMNFMYGVKHKPLQPKLFDSIGKQSGTVIVRIHNSTDDRVRLANELRDTFVAIGITVIIQDGYHGHDFTGLLVRPAPNAPAIATASLIYQKLSESGMKVSLANEQSAWGAEHIVLIEIGAP